MSEEEPTSIEEELPPGTEGAIEGEGEAVEGEAEGLEDDDNELDDDFDPTDIPEKFQGPEGRDEADIPEGVD